MIDIIELSEEAHGISVDHGWWDQQCPEHQIRILIVSEISEALEDYRKSKNLRAITVNVRGVEDGIDALEFEGKSDDLLKIVGGNHKPTGFPTEIADIVIRCSDWIGSFEDDDLAKVIRLQLRNWVPTGETDIVKMLDDATGSMYPFLNDGLVTTIGTCYDIANVVKFNLDDAIRVKCAYNKTRPMHHGGKKI